MYYQLVYNELFATIRAVYGSLLTRSEHALIDELLSLDTNAQRLIYRLLGRLRIWFSVDRLAYKEIAISLEDISELLLSRNPKEPLPYLQAMLVEQLRELAVECEVDSWKAIQGMDSAALCRMIANARPPKQSSLSFTENGHMSLRKSICMFEKVKSRVKGDLIKLSDRFIAFHDGFCLPLYFASNPLNPEDELRAAMLSQTNQRTYPVYHVLRSKSLFQDRQAFDNFMESIYYLKIMENITGKECVQYEADLCLAAFKSFLPDGDHDADYLSRRFTPVWVYARILTFWAKRLEEMDEYERAVNILHCLLSQQSVCRERRGAWWERLIIDTCKHLKWNDGEQLCEQALQDTHVRMGHRHAIWKRIHGKSENCNYIFRKVHRVPLQKSKKGKLSFLLDDVEGTTGDVEQVALKYYVEEHRWTGGVHSESGVFCMLFALIFWDILFMAVPNVFQTPYQSFPLDLKTDLFYENRRERIDVRLEELKDKKFTLSKMKSSYSSYNGLSCIGCNWDAYDWSILETVFSALLGLPLMIIMRLLAKDYRNHCSGMPDLIVWRDQELMLVEVKSLSDKLSDQQHMWLEILIDAGVSVEVFQVV